MFSSYFFMDPITSFRAHAKNCNETRGEYVGWWHETHPCFCRSTSIIQLCQLHKWGELPMSFPWTPSLSDVSGSSLLLSCAFNGGQQPAHCLRRWHCIFKYVESFFELLHSTRSSRDALFCQHFLCWAWGRACSNRFWGKMFKKNLPTGSLYIIHVVKDLIFCSYCRWTFVWFCPWAGCHVNGSWRPRQSCVGESFWHGDFSMCLDSSLGC